MNAFLLAAGLGTRLRPLTNEIPKCMVDICGRPLMEWWLIKLEECGVKKALVNTHHLPEKVREFVGTYDGGVEIVLSHEDKLLGSAGTVRANRDFIEDKPFFIIYADDLTDVKLDGIMDFHLKNNAILTVGVMEMPCPEARGIAVLDDDGVITEFVEKPPNPPGKLANAGIMAASPELYGCFDDRKTPLDFGYDILPAMAGKMYGFRLEGYLQDIGTPDDLDSARTKWGEMIASNQVRYKYPP